MVQGEATKAMRTLKNKSSESGDIYPEGKAIQILNGFFSKRN